MRNITVYNFFKTNYDGGADYIKDGKITHLSAEMFACMIHQYKVMGFSVFYDNPSFTSVSKVEEDR